MPKKKVKEEKKKCCCDDKVGYLEEWLLVVIGALGFAQALNIVNLEPFQFKYVWSVLVLVIGITKLLQRSSCNC
ncbi:MAG: hypothetical protein QXT25_00005 [Candidatus Anstonellaceae archaeon]